MKTKNILICILLIASSLASCKKYPEGPSISLRSRTARVTNTWKMEMVMENGSDITSTLNNIHYTETYDKNGNYSYNSTAGSGSGRWMFENKETHIRRQAVSGQPTVDLIILRLKEKSFWYRYTDGNEVFEFHLIPN
jgi:hypothetical protein